MHIVSADTILADLATELDVTPTEASLYLNELLEDSDDSDNSEYDS